MDDNDLTELARGVVPFVHEAIAEALAKVPPPSEVVVNEEKARAGADRELAAEIERLHKRFDSIDLASVVLPEIAEQMVLAVRMLHESPPVAEPKPPPPPKVIRIERDVDGSMVPIYGEP